MVVVPPIAAATVPVRKSSLTRTCADRKMQVGVHVDAAGHEQPARALDDGLARLGFERGRDRGDATVAADAQVGAPLAVDVENGSAAQQHGVRVHRDGVAHRIHRRAVQRRRTGPARARRGRGGARRPGCAVDFGPFGSSVEGDDDQVLAAADAVVRAAIGAGATRVSHADHPALVSLAGTVPCSIHRSFTALH